MGLLASGSNTAVANHSIPFNSGFALFFGWVRGLVRFRTRIMFRESFGSLGHGLCFGRLLWSAALVGSWIHTVGSLTLAHSSVIPNLLPPLGEALAVFLAASPA